MTPFVVSFIATVAFFGIAQVLLNWQLGDAHKRLDLQMNVITHLEMELYELKHKVHEMKGGAE